MRFARENQKGRLERVFRGIFVVENAPADSQDHGSVPMQQGLEGMGILPRAEPLKQAAIANPMVRRGAGASRGLRPVVRADWGALPSWTGGHPKSSRRNSSATKLEQATNASRARRPPAYSIPFARRVGSV
jgi:hypothetical protein